MGREAAASAGAGVPMLLNWALCSAGLLVLLLVADVAYAVLCTGCTARDAVQLILAHWGIMEPPPRLLNPSTHAAATSSSSSGSPDDAGEKFTVAQERMSANAASPGRLSTAALQRKSRATTERGARPGTSLPAREPLKPPPPVRTTAKGKAAPKDAAARSKRGTTTDGNPTGAMPAPLWSASSYETTPAILRQRLRRAEGKAGAGWACCSAPPSSAAARPNFPRPSRPLPPPGALGRSLPLGASAHTPSAPATAAAADAGAPSSRSVDAAAADASAVAATAAPLEGPSAERHGCTQKELDALDEFRERLWDEGWLERAVPMFAKFGGEDKCLLRFLRAYKCDKLDVRTAFSPPGSCSAVDRNSCTRSVHRGWDDDEDDNDDNKDHGLH